LVLLGGVLTLFASFAAQRNAVAVDRTDRTTRVVTRVRRYLRRIITMCEQLRGHSPHLRLDVTIIDDAAQVWTAYAGVSDDLHLLGDSQLEEETDAVFAGFRMGAASLREIERQHERDLLRAEQLHNSDDKRREHFLRPVRERDATERQAMLDAMQGLSTRAATLLVEFERRFGNEPSPPGPK
jgi:hypothetical protein